MLSDERFDLCQNRLLFHDAAVSRVITRMSTYVAGNCSILRAASRETIAFSMEGAPSVDVEKLKADVITYVERSGMSQRKFSRLASAGRNEGLYRDLITKGQDKQISVDLLFGVARALGRNPFDYIVGLDAEFQLPSASVLMSTFALLLESLGIDPLEGGRAQRLASTFPGALRRQQALQERARADQDSPAEVGAPALDEDRPSA